MKKNWLYLRCNSGVSKLLRKMKLTIFLLLTTILGSMAAGSYSQTAKLTLDFKNMTVKEILSNIEDQSEFRFFYSGSVDVERRTSISLKNEKIFDVLDELFKDTGVKYEVRGRQIALVKGNETFGFESVQTAQQRTVSGIVTDEPGEPLPGVTVVVKGTTQGTVTNNDGEYTLLNVPDDATLVFSFVGMRTQEVEVGDERTINVSMEAETFGVDEVVVVGYGTMAKSDITGSVASVSKERLELSANNNLAQVLQGSMPGFSVTQTEAGAEGGNYSLLLRGRNSITANNNPLIILDGIPYSGNISDINPKDIASVEVLKDASSAAIYGSRASNGVILITTNKGLSATPTLTFDSYYGIMNISNLPDLMDGEEYYQYKLERDPSTITLSEENNYNQKKFTEWVDLATRTGHKQQYNLNISSKTENTAIYISGSFLDIKGIAVNDDYSRYSLRFNVDQTISDWITIGTNTQLALSDRSGVPAGFSAAFTMNPLTSAYEEDGKTLTVFPWPEDVYFRNPLGNILSVDDNYSYSVFSNNYIDADLKFIPGLTYKLNTGVDYNQNKNGQYEGRGTKSGYENRGIANIRDRLNLNLILENILRYQKSIGQHNLDVTGLYSYQQNTYKANNIYGQGFPNDFLTYYQVNIGELTSASANYSKDVVVSQMGRFNYNYDDRYLVTFTGRRDGYSGFGRDQKYGFFPSFALGWNISNERFMENNKSINFLKIRASYGENGNQAVGPFNTLARMNTEPYLNGSSTVAGFIPGSLENNNLGWETTASFNLGIDYMILQERFQGSVNYYNSVTSNLLLDRSISSTHGITSITQNVGKTQNTGFELSVISHNLKRSQFRWTTDLNFSLNRNKILELVTKEDDVSNLWFIGKPVQVNYDLLFDGVFQENDDIANSAQPNAEPGYAKIKDVNEDGEINAEDRTFIGSREPDFIWGMNNSFAFKNFSLDIFIHGIQGITRRNHLLGDDPAGDDTRKRFRINTPMWTPENPINTMWANDVNANPHRVFIYENASFVRIKDITLGYNLPAGFNSRMGINSSRVYLNLRNAFTITDWRGLDPELNDQRAIPLQREFIVGINFQF
ncbi:MAG: TonB-dependent receptor [Bacteroidota bacterium]